MSSCYNCGYKVSVVCRDEIGWLCEWCGDMELGGVDHKKNQEKAEKYDKITSQLKEDHGWHYFQNGEFIHIGISVEFRGFSYGLPIRLFETSKSDSRDFDVRITHCAINLKKILATKEEN